VDQPQLNWIANYIWGIADDVLRDLYVRGKYRDVILPITVLRRLDSLLEPTKPAVLDMRATLDKVRIVNQDQALRQAAGQAFYGRPASGRDRLSAKSTDLIHRAREWQRVNGMRKPEEFREAIYPLLEDVSIRELVRRTGLSLAYCRKIKRGLVVPHPMWWEALAAVTS
jgi:hypothetical protein